MKQGHLAHEAAQDRLRRRDKDKARLVLEDLRDVMRTPAGRRFAYHLIAERSAVFSSSMTADALGTAYGEGRRAVGIELMGLAQRECPDLYVRMLQEQLEEQMDDAIHRRDAESAALKEPEE